MRAVVGVVAAVLAVAWPGVAMAEAPTITGTDGPDTLRGTAAGERLEGGAGADRIDGGGGRDVVRCGPGRDTARVDRRDRVVGCERVRRFRGPRSRRPAERVPLARRTADAVARTLSAFGRR